MSRLILTKDLCHYIFDYVDGDLFFKDEAHNGNRAGSLVYLKEPSGYLYVQLDNYRYKAHRIVWTMFNDIIPEDYVIDHINGVRDDNKISNLRLATLSQNRVNSAKSENTSSKYKGVYWKSKDKKWVAQITAKPSRNRVYLGGFDTQEEAAIAYNEAAIQLFGEFAILNTIGEG